MENNELVELMISKVRQMYPKPKEKEHKSGDFAIISFKVDKILKGKPKIDKKWNTILVKGNLPIIEERKSYFLIGQERFDEKYKADYYEPIHIGKEIRGIEKEEDIRYLLEKVTSKNNTDRIMEIKNLKEVLRSENIKELKKVKGIGDKIAKKILKKYNEQAELGEGYVKLCRLGFSKSVIDKLKEKYGSHEESYSVVCQNPYEVASDIKGIGFLRAEELATKVNIDQNSIQRIRAFTNYYLSEKAKEGKSYVETRELLNSLRSITDEVKFPISKPILTKTFELMRMRDELWWDSKKTILASPYIRDTERNIAKNLFRLVNAKVENDISNWEEVVKDIEEKNGFDYTNEQRKGIETILNNNVVVVTGLAGTGKTTVLEPMMKILVEQQKKKILQMALAGKASQRMQEVTGYEAKTIHRGLDFSPGFGFTRNKENPLEQDIIVLDEASMVDAPLFNKILEAIKEGSKLLILGDYGQLAPIGFGQVFLDLIESNLIPVVKLTKIHRQASKSAVITESIKIRNKQHIIEHEGERTDTLGELQDLKLDIFKDRESLADKVVDCFEDRLIVEKDLMEVQVVVTTRTRGELSAFKINNRIQELLHPNIEKDNNYIESALDKNHKYKIYECDKVIVVQNNYKVKVYNENSDRFIDGAIFNGNLGIVTNIGVGYIDVDIKGVGLVKIEEKDYGSLELGYAITCHKSQGSGWKSTIVAVDSGAYLMLSCEWLYTAITRTMKYCNLVGETKAIRRCCSISQGGQKKTFLPYMLREFFG